MEFFKKVGTVAIGSRLRMLTEKITEDSANIYKLYQIDMQPKWFPVFYVISNGEEKTVTQIAREIGHSHPSVSKILTEMANAGLITEKKDKADGRRTLIKLSKKGTEITHKIKNQYTDIESAINQITQQTKNNLWKAIEEWEFILEQKSLLQRVKEQQKERESKKVQIVNYEAQYRDAFRELNIEWIKAYFTMEESDYKMLDDPEGYIIKNDGHIFVALYENEPVGVCSLLKTKDPEYTYELAKMAVSPLAQGKHVGWLLGQAIVEKARSLGAEKLYLESNTVLKPAINLYHKLGFHKIDGRDSQYERVNIQMELKL